VISSSEQRALFAQLKESGFTEIVLPDSKYHIFFAPRVSVP
jgi:hypothetical protein